MIFGGWLQCLIPEVHNWAELYTKNKLVIKNDKNLVVERYQLSKNDEAFIVGIENDLYANISIIANMMNTGTSSSKVGELHKRILLRCVSSNIALLSDDFDVITESIVTSPIFNTGSIFVNELESIFTRIRASSGMYYINIFITEDNMIRIPKKYQSWKYRYYDHIKAGKIPHTLFDDDPPQHRLGAYIERAERCSNDGLYEVLM